jgi:SM-20-related protein
MGPNPGPEPQPQPQPPHTILPDRRTAVMERTTTERAQCVVLDEFLAPQELEELMRFTLSHEADFTVSEVVSPSGQEGMINYDHRRSRVFVELEAFQPMMLERIQSVLPQVCEKLGMEMFPVRSVEAQITASNDGDFFHCHNDNGDSKVSSRHLTFVYFFHREPRAFEGGELVIYGEHGKDLNGAEREEEYRAITPQQNQIVFFPCELVHEITELKCASRTFADSRFTLNGWLHC